MGNDAEEQAANCAHGICRGMGHLHDYIPARGGKRADKRPKAVEREISRQLHDDRLRTDIEGLRRTERGARYNPQHNGHGNNIALVCRKHRQCRRTSGQGRADRKPREQLFQRQSCRRLSQRHADKQERAAARKIYQRHRHTATAQVACHLR